MIQTLSSERRFGAKVIGINRNTGFAKVMEEDGALHDLFLPSFFGGQAAPYPKVGDTLRVIYDKRSERIIEAYIPKVVSA